LAVETIEKKIGPVRDRGLLAQNLSVPVEEQVQFSLLGTFTKNYKQFKAQNGAEYVEEVLLNCFHGSSILHDIDSKSPLWLILLFVGAILFFNLPHELQMKKFRKIYPNKKGGDNTFRTLISENFEHIETPSVIVMKVEEKRIVGAFATHSWSLSDLQRGDPNCFMFNISQNIRIDALPGNPYYQDVQQTDGILKLAFGDNDLIIEDEFKRVSSFIRNSFYSFGHDYFLKNKVTSIVPGRNIMKPSACEIWVLD